MSLYIKIYGYKSRLCLNLVSNFQVQINIPNLESNLFMLKLVLNIVRLNSNFTELDSITSKKGRRVEIKNSNFKESELIWGSVQLFGLPFLINWGGGQVHDSILRGKFSHEFEVHINK
jgi:hypothetical protein